MPTIDSGERRILMSSPMVDLPFCVPIPVDADGNGPADDQDTVAVVCWTHDCGKPWSDELRDNCPRKGEVE